MACSCAKKLFEHTICRGAVIEVSTYKDSNCDICFADLRAHFQGPRIIVFFHNCDHVLKRDTLGASLTSWKHNCAKNTKCIFKPLSPLKTNMLMPHDIQNTYASTRRHAEQICKLHIWSACQRVLAYMFWISGGISIFVLRGAMRLNMHCVFQA